MRKVEVSKLGTIILISEVIGIDRTLVLCEVFQGEQIYIPKPDSILAALRDREIIKEIKKRRELNIGIRNTMLGSWLRSLNYQRQVFI
tara:strand:- start:452 stop:715 length:264 start_codon:yes stop_codon:yes gene_type:complete